MLSKEHIRYRIDAIRNGSTCSVYMLVADIKPERYDSAEVSPICRLCELNDVCLEYADVLSFAIE